MIAIVNYGLSNLLSIVRATQMLAEEDVVVSDEKSVIAQADKIILPGVGAFRYGMTCLRTKQLDIVLLEKAENGVPLLGICLGMQMLFDRSEEGGITSGLGLVSGDVVRIPPTDVENVDQKVPQIGWNTLKKRGLCCGWHDILDGIKEKDEVYFVHSYEGMPLKEEQYIANTFYGGREVCAVVQNKNVVGCQFHPEKSGEVGLKILKNFILEF